jgi:hypothetical protein
VRAARTPFAGRPSSHGRTACHDVRVWRPRLAWLALGVALSSVGCRGAVPPVTSSGVVRSAAGAAIAGARVCAWPLTFNRRHVGWRPTCAVTDDHGRYVLELAEGSTVHVIADAEGFLPGVHRAHPAPSWPWLTVSSDPPPASIDVTLEPGGQWHRGRVVDPEGRPIANGMIVLATFGDDRVHVPTATTTDADGRYEAWGHPSARATPRIDGWVLTDAIERETPDGPQLVAIPESRIRGRVVTDAGDPVPGARVTVSDGPLPYGNPTVATRADRSGRFELRGLSPGEHVVVAHTPRAKGKSAAVWVGLAEVSAPITVRLEQPLAPVRARVIDADTGEGVAHCTVGLRTSSEAMRLPAWFRTDGRGRLDIELPAGTYVVDGLSCSRHAARPPYPALEVGADDPAWARWEVDRGTTFRGRLVDAHGRPVAAQWVSLTVDGRGLDERSFFVADPRIQTAADGSFEASGLRPGPYRLFAQLDFTHPPIHVEVREAGEVATIRLPAMGRLEVVVPGARDGLRVEARACPERSPYGLELDERLERDGPRTTSGYTGAGRAVFEGIAPGRYLVSHDHPWSGCEADGAANIVTVAADRTTTTTLRVPAPVAEVRAITGAVHGPDGAPRRGAFVELVERGSIGAKEDGPLDWTGFGPPRVVTDETGGFAFAAREPGEYIVRAHAPGLLAQATVDARTRDGVLTLTLR